MAFSKIILNGTTLMDVTQKTVAANSMLDGVTALDAAGQDVTGTIVNKSSSDLTVSGTTVNVPVGNYPQGASIDMSSSIVDLVYPVGSIYMSTSSTSPATLFAGTTWTQLQDTFLLAAGSTYAAGATGGEATHTLTTDEMPSHRHEGLEYGDTGRNVGFDNGSYNDAYKLSWATPASRTATVFTDYAGGGQAHNNMPPYLAVYMWQRTA